MTWLKSGGKHKISAVNGTNNDESLDHVANGKNYSSDKCYKLTKMLYNVIQNLKTKLMCYRSAFNSLMSIRLTCLLYGLNFMAFPRIISPHFLGTHLH